MTETTTDLELIYVADPMCSWCWGFSSVLEQVIDGFDIPISLVIGGLRPEGQAKPLDDQLRSTIGGHWDRIAKLTGQPFDLAGLDRDNWVYDTMVPDVATVLMRDKAPEEAFRFFRVVQRAFYADGIDITDPSVYLDLLDGFPVDAEGFVTELQTEDARVLTRSEFARARELQVEGYPTLLLRIGEASTAVMFGYEPFESVSEQIKSRLNRVLDEVAVGQACRIGEVC